MSRQKHKGTRFESAVRGFLREALGDQSIDRMALHGGDDEGDISGVRCRGLDVVIECKDTRRLELTEHLREARREAQAHREAGHPTLCGVLVQHAPGVGTTRMGDQWVVMSLGDFTSIISKVDARRTE